MIGTIEINRLKLFGRHGVYEHERLNGNIFEYTVHLKYPVATAMMTDKLGYSLDYDSVIREIMKINDEPAALLECLAGQIYHRLITVFPKIEGGMVHIAKTKPPIDAEIQNTAVRLEW